MGLGKSILITCVYIPFSHSRYGRREHSDFSIKFFLSYNDYCYRVNIDFSAHTFTFPDLIPVSDENQRFCQQKIFVVFQGRQVSLVNRCNQDITPYGKKLIEICRGNKVIIFNGRIGDDAVIGNYISTID